jgi:5-formyltetrahydrofolate cyclo-ligase
VPTHSLISEKKQLRHAMREVLGHFGAHEALSAGIAISNHLSDWSSWRAAKAVAIFSTLPGEVDTQPVIDRCRDDAKGLLFPRMLEGRTLEFARVEKFHTLKAGRYGVLEPDARCRPQPIGEGVIVLVPGLAFDRLGGRLGRGAGYYDRALRGVERQRGLPLFIGVAFEDQIVASVPMAANDVRLDGVVTERGLVLIE